MNEQQAPETTPEKTSVGLRLFKEYAPYVLIGLILSLVIRLLISPTIVVGHSMEGSLHEGDYLIVNKMSYKAGEPHYGDVVILDSDAVEGHDVFIKRIVGLPGDTIEIKHNKLIRNGKVIKESYIKEKMYTSDMKIAIPKEEVFVMGDNRNHSMDSRIIGTVNYKKEVIGKAVMRVKPFDQGYKVN